MIEVENLSKYYDGFCAVNRIDFSIQKGEIVGLLGPNGAGKTTTLRMLTGYLPPTSGNIKIKDFSIRSDLIAIKHLMGYLPESAPLYRSMLVYDYLEYVARVRGLEDKRRHDRIRELSELCGLREIMHFSIGELSRGLKQRVGLAHAMMSDPEILVLDEPTSGLDPNQIVEIRDIIRHAAKEKTIVLSTHILSEAEATCDRVIIIHRGKIVADDDTQRLMEISGLKHVVTLSLRQASAEAAMDRLKAIDGVLDVQESSQSEDGALDLAVTCREGSDPREAIYHAVKQTDWILIDLHLKTQNLETIFRELTRED
ncbi:MAG: ABC transporter [Desulfobacterales bacterium CG23_combo_of_CG06-09_8_20_14_all_52_9]|nr:MAG: ABC transporter [Desulfobacterales bacterium CG23_combo_of_CG06-09_8_20_14_all_52_9]